MNANKVLKNTNLFWKEMFGAGESRRRKERAMLLPDLDDLYTESQKIFLKVLSE